MFCVIIAQRLVRRLQEEKTPYSLSAQDLKLLGPYCNLERIEEVLRQEKLITVKQKLQQATFFKPKATKESDRGDKGRLGIYEVLQVTETIKELIIRGATSDQLQAQAEKEGMFTMVEDGFLKAAKGITSIEEVIRVVTE